MKTSDRQRTLPAPAAPARRDVPGGLALAAGLLMTLQAATVIDDFNDGGHWTGITDRHGGLSLETLDGQLQISGPPGSRIDLLSAVWYMQPDLEPLPILPGRTLELRVDRVRASEDPITGGIGFEVEGNPNNRGYAFYYLPTEVLLVKYGPHGAAWLFTDTPTRSTGPVVLKLGFTQVSAGLQLTTTVLQQDAPHSVLFERAVVDTWARDPVVEGHASDPGQPYIEPSFDVWLGMVRHGPIQSDRIEIVYDNFEYSYIPIPDVQKAVCLSWPVPEGEYVVESAPTLDGPWELVTPGATSVDEDRQRVWVLAEDQAGFFRLREVETP